MYGQREFLLEEPQGARAAFENVPSVLRVESVQRYMLFLRRTKWRGFPLGSVVVYPGIA